MKTEEKAIRFLMSYFNASEFEDSRDEFTESWVAVAGCLKAYAEHCENEYRGKLNKVLNNLGEDEFVRLEQENKELREKIERMKSDHHWKAFGRPPQKH